MVDIHCHILYEVDDGSRSYEESMEMLMKAKKMGYKKIMATSHYPGGDEEQRLISYEVMKGEAEKQGMELHLGREIMISPESLKSIVRWELGSLAQGKYLLVEFQPGTISRSGLGAVEVILKSGYTPVVAHVERYSWEREDLIRLKKLGAILQMNVRAGASGREEWRSWLTEGIIDILATDSHRSSGRSYDLAAELQTLRGILGEERFRELTEINPGKVIKGERIAQILPLEKRERRSLLGRLFRRRG